MPNHVINELVFRETDEAARSRIIAATCNAEGKVDFEILVPTPLNMWWGNVGSNHEAAFKRTALDWNRANWGTKWNAYDQQPHEIGGETLTMRFETAWSPPYPWLAAVFNSLKVDFDHNWLSEGGSPAKHGEFRHTDHPLMGVQWIETEADDALQRHLHLLLWGVEAFDDEPETGGGKLLPTDPTGSADSQSQEPAGPTVGAKTPPPPLADGEPEKEDFGADLSQPHRLSGSHITNTATDTAHLSRQPSGHKGNHHG